jgi:hypothetical protein
MDCALPGAGSPLRRQQTNPANYQFSVSRLPAEIDCMQLEVQST